MSIENTRLRELSSLIRTKQIEMEMLQLCLREAHARKLDPAQLGVHIADLGRQLSRWERERAFLLRERVDEEEDRYGAVPDRYGRPSMSSTRGDLV